MQITYIPYTTYTIMNYYHYQLLLFCRLKNATFTFAVPYTQSEISDMEMKTCITIILLLLMLVSSCSYVLSCRVKVRTPDFKQLEGAASNALQKGIQSMGQQMQRFTDNGIQLLQTMGTSVSQFLSEISDTTEKGIETIGKQVEGIRTDTNRQLENIVNDVNRTLGELVLRVDKVGEAINKNIMPPLTSILNNANVIVKKAHTVVDIWIVLLLLFGFFVSRYLRLLTGNDFVSLCEYVILSFSELILLNGAVIVLIVTLHKFIVSEDDEKKILDEMSPEAGVQNERLLKFMVILNVLIIVIFGTLRLVRKIDVKAVLAIFFWPLQKKISVGLRALLFLFVIATSVFFYYSTSSIFTSILSYIVLFVGIGVSLY